MDTRSITRALVEAHTVGYYRNAGGTRPDLRVVEIDGRMMVVKDFKGSDALFRRIVGPIMIRREFGALGNLIGVEGVPQLISRIDRYAIAMEHIPARSLIDITPGTLNAEFYERLARTVESIHSRGLAHCDLRSRGNVMVDSEGRPYVVDFAACVYRGRGINPFTRGLFGEFVKADRNAVLRIKQRLSPELITPAERDELARPLPYERPAKFIGESIRKITRRLLTLRSTSR